MEFREIFFNEEIHKYTDELNNPYISVTTLIGEYEVKFDIQKMAKVCAKGQKGRYKGLTEKDIIKLWDKERDNACKKGSKTHNIQELSINESNGYIETILPTKKKNRLLCVSDILQVCNFGEVNLDILKGKLIKFPLIYQSIEKLVNNGYKIYSEIGIYWYPFLVSGCIDLFAYKESTKEFMILDWKTNIDELTFESGYYKKDANGNRTKEWIVKDEVMKYPLSHLSNSSGNKYSLQLSLYAYMCELWGLTCNGLYLFHITDEKDDSDCNIVHRHKVNYLKKEVKDMIDNYTRKHKSGLNIQMNMLNLLF